MAENVQQSIEVPIGLSVFGSLITEMAASDLPEGVSPDNQDVVYLPGSVASRPGMHKLYPQLANNVTVTYAKTFVKPDGTVTNLILDSAGNLWVENVTLAPGILIALASVSPGSYCTSCTAFGREYLAFHDGTKGTDSPRQFDGVTVERVSQDGPAAAPLVSDEQLSYAIASITLQAALVIGAAPNGATQVGNLVTLTLAAGSTFGLVVGDTILVAGVTNGGYNGTFIIVALTNTTIQYNCGTTGLAGSGAGTITTGLADVVPTVPAWGFIGTNGAVYLLISGATTAGYNATWPVRIVIIGGGSPHVTIQTNVIGLANSGAAGTMAAAGNIPAGVHSCVVMFLTRQGYITIPSPPVSWTAAGGKRVVVSNLPLGPSNVVARIIAFTGSGGSRFFFILNSITTPIYIGSTSVLDNVSSQAVIDFSDTSLFAANAIDIPGNNLFAQTVLGPSIGVFNYASRMLWWGKPNKINNLLNMGFEGGYLSATPTVPLGWTVETAGGILTTLNVNFGQGWAILGDGTVNPRGRISQPAYQDLLGVVILQPRTAYSFNFWVNLVNGNAGTIVAEIYSAGSGGVLASASVLCSTLTARKFFTVAFNQNTPTVIPNDTVLRVYTINTLNLQSVILDELFISPNLQPQSNQFSFSYINNPEAFDGITGLLGSTEDPTVPQACFNYKDSLHFLTGRGLHNTQDVSNSEPARWSVREISNRCGAASSRSCDMGENFAVWATAPINEPPTGNGLYVFTGGSVYKVSQEIQPQFDAINPAARKTIWVKNDPVDRRVYVGIPHGTATAPDQILILDYRELDTASDIASRPPIHISFTGRMICSDLSRKWTRWTVSANCGELLRIGGNLVRFCVGAGNGQTPGVANGFGNVYYFDPLKLTDDDYGLIVPYYITYFFVNHEAEQALQVGLHRKLFKRYNAYINGVGQLQLTAYADTLSNPYPSPVLLPLNNPQFFDMGDGLNVLAERVAFKIASIPHIGQTDNKFDIGKFIVTMMQEPVAPLSFGAV